MPSRKITASGERDKVHELGARMVIAGEEAPQHARGVSQNFVLVRVGKQRLVLTEIANVIVAMWWPRSRYERPSSCSPVCSFSNFTFK
jgi:hypothetical protein